MKKLLISLICLSMIISMCACAPTNKDNSPDTNEPVENPATDFKYEFLGEKEYAVITQYIGTSKNVVIPSTIEGCPVTSLKGFEVDGTIQGVFQDATVETVVIPKSVKWIGNRTFKNCTALTSVTLRENSDLQVISIEAFENCTSLKNINLEVAQNLKTIENVAFRNCSSIEKMKFPANLETIGEEAFSNCSALKCINIPKNLGLMNVEAASFCDLPSLEEIVFDEGRETIHGYAFFGITSTVNIRIPKSVTSVGIWTFSNSGTMNLYFAGNCPQFVDADQFAGNTVIYYDSTTTGWDTTPLREFHTFISN